MAKARLQAELKQVQEHPAFEYSSLGPVTDRNIFVWQACLFGPPRTPYEGGKFMIEIRYPTDYPFKPPEVRFITKIFHPNVSSDGKVCVDGDWTPTVTTSSLMTSLSLLLSYPDPGNHVFTEAAKMYQNDPARFNEVAKEWTESYACKTFQA